MPAGSIWRCPCGREGPYEVIIGHRHGWKNRVGCQDGEIYQISPPPDDPIVAAAPGESDAAKPVEPTPPPAPTPRPPAYEYVDTVLAPNEVDDDEEVARFLNAQREGRIAADLAPPVARNGASHPFAGLEADGGGGDEPPIDGEGDSSGEGDGEDFTIIPSPADKGPTRERVTITVPPSVKIFYQWSKDMGWHAGNDTLDDFFLDFINTHFRICMGRRILVTGVDEVMGG